MQSLRDWHDDDITFCMSKCDNTKCRRHPSNIKIKNIPHSFALLEGSDLCEKEDSNGTKTGCGTGRKQ